MARPTLEVTFQLGRSVGKYDATKTDGSRQLVDEIAAAMGGEVAHRVKLRLTQMTKQLYKAVSDELAYAIREAATSMVGTQSRGGYMDRERSINVTGIPIRVFGDTVAMWRPLSKRTHVEQEKFGNKPARFFSRTGALRMALLGLARQMVKRTGVVKVDVRDAAGSFRRIRASDRVIPVADVRIRLLPNIFPNQLPGLRTGSVADFNPNLSFEKALGLSDEMIEKLRGPFGGNPMYHRPLLQPIFTYWVLNRIPNRVANIINRNIQVSSGRRGIEDYSTG